MGGKLVATNIVSRNIACTAVTSIGLDHQEILGNTLEEIAGEKAGILKEGIKGCVVGPTSSQFPVFREAYAKTGAPLDNFVEILPKSLKEGTGAEENKSMGSESPMTFQKVNTEIARQVLRIALDKTAEEFDQLVPSEILADAKPPCRLEPAMPLSEDVQSSLREHNVQIVLDVCHNAQGLQHVLAELVTS